MKVTPIIPIQALKNNRRPNQREKKTKKQKFELPQPPNDCA